MRTAPVMILPAALANQRGHQPDRRKGLRAVEVDKLVLGFAQRGMIRQSLGTTAGSERRRGKPLALPFPPPCAPLMVGATLTQSREQTP